MRECEKCGQTDHWRRMEAHKETKYRIKAAICRAGKSAEKDDVKSGTQYGEYTYTCIRCVCERDGVEPVEARRRIKQPRTQKGVERCRAFQQAMEQVQDDFMFLLIDAETTATDVERKNEITMSDPLSGQKGEIRATSKRQMKKLKRKAAQLKAKSMAQQRERAAARALRQGWAAGTRPTRHGSPLHGSPLRADESDLGAQSAHYRSRTPTRRCDVDACFESDTPPGLQCSQSSIAQETLLADLMAAPLDGWSDRSKQKLASEFRSPESLLCLVLVCEDDARSLKYLARSCSRCGMHHLLTSVFGKQLPIGHSLILFQWLKKTYAPLVWGSSYALLEFPPGGNDAGARGLARAIACIKRGTAPCST